MNCAAYARKECVRQLQAMSDKRVIILPKTGNLPILRCKNIRDRGRQANITHEKTITLM